MFDSISSRLHRPAPGTVIGLLALVVASSGVAYASIPNPDGTIKGCYATTSDLLLGIPHSKGDTRIVDSAEACRSYEQSITLAGGSQITALAARVSALERDNTALKARVTTLESDNTTLKTRTSALETKLSKVTYTPTGLNGKPTLRIDAANLQITSGAGATDAPINGLGNLFIGYDEQNVTPAPVQTGSHSLVLGINQTVTSYGGLVTGATNTLAGPFSWVGGTANTASGPVSAALGGINNRASGAFSAILGGESNTASGDASSIVGGTGNRASGFGSSILGGAGHIVSGDFQTSP